MESEADAPLPTSALVSIVVSVIATLLVLLGTFVYFRWTSGAKRSLVLLVGLSNSGKTVFFERLRSNQLISTFNSSKPNDAFIAIHQDDSTTATATATADSQTLPRQRVIDIPGHDRIRLRSVNQFAQATKGIVFFVDASTLLRDVTSVTQFLYDILTLPTIAKSKVPLLIAFNKTDLLTAMDPTKAQSLIEREVNIVRKTRTAAPSPGSDASSTSFLGSEDADFAFSQLRTPVTFLEVSGKEGRGVADVRKWIAQLR